MSSNYLLEQFLDAHRLEGAENYSDWLMNLRIVLDSEKLGYIIDQPMPLGISDDASLEERQTYQKWVDDDLRVKSYILASMVPLLRRLHMDMDNASAIMLHLKELFGERKEVVVCRVAKALFQARLNEGNPVSPHVLRMIGYIEKLKQMDLVLDNNLGNILILQSLPSSFAQFVMSFNMLKKSCSYGELHNLLQIAEEDMKKGAQTHLFQGTSSSASKAVGKSKGNKKMKATPKVPPQGGVTKPTDKDKGVCFFCGKFGHWNCNCPRYVAGQKKVSKGSEGK